MKSTIEKHHKTYVDVVSKTDTSGNVRPLIIIWEDGKKFAIDRLRDIRPAVSLKVGGSGIRYTIEICGKQTYLFNDDGRWFVEAKGE